LHGNAVSIEIYLTLQITIEQPVLGTNAGKQLSQTATDV